MALQIKNEACRLLLVKKACDTYSVSVKTCTCVYVCLLSYHVLNARGAVSRWHWHSGMGLTEKKKKKERKGISHSDQQKV